MKLQRLATDIISYFSGSVKPLRYSYFDNLNNCCAFTAASRLHGGPDGNPVLIDKFVMARYTLSQRQAGAFVAGWEGTDYICNDNEEYQCMEIGQKLWAQVKP